MLGWFLGANSLSFNNLSRAAILARPLAIKEELDENGNQAC